MTRIAHLMTPQPSTISLTATAEEAGRRMAARHLRHLPVVDDGGRLVGILSDRDLRGPMVGNQRARAAAAPNAPVGALMTRTVATAGPDDDLGTVARIIVERQVGAVPIVDADGVPVGIVSFVDVMRRLAEDAAQDARAIELMDAR